MPVAPPTSEMPKNSSIEPARPEIPPSMLPGSTLKRIKDKLYVIFCSAIENKIILNAILYGWSLVEVADHDVPPVSLPPFGMFQKNGGVPVAAPLFEIPKPMTSVAHAPNNGR